MSIKPILLFLIVHLAFIPKVKAQNNFIIAGKHSSSDYYYKYTPDSVVINIPGSTLGNPQTKYYYLDINNDGINDFKFSLTNPGSALGSNYYDCFLKGLNNNNIVLNYYDSCFYNSGGFKGRYGIAKGFHYSDTINSNENWDSLAYLKYVWYSMSMGTCTDSYTDTNYIGLRLQVGSSYSYGWLKIVSLVFGFSQNATTLTMGTFACGSNNVTGINTEKNNTEIIVFPNPADNILHIKNVIEESILEIRDVTGKLILRKNINAAEATEVSMLAPGIYNVCVSNSRQSTNKRLLLVR